MATANPGINDELTERLEAMERDVQEMDGQLIGNPAALQVRLEQRPLLQSPLTTGKPVIGRPAMGKKLGAP